MEYNKTTQVIIPISEYNELLEIKKTFVKAFEDKQPIVRFRWWNSGPGGPIHEYTLINAPDELLSLKKELDESIIKSQTLSNELYELKRKFRNKMWYEFIPVK